MLGLIVSIINKKQNIRENIVVLVLRLIGKTHPNTFANSAAKFECWFRKTNTVIYYLNIKLILIQQNLKILLILRS